MNFFEELEQTLTTLYPGMKLGDESLKNIRYTNNPIIPVKLENQDFVLKKKNIVDDLLKPFLDSLAEIKIIKPEDRSEVSKPIDLQTDIEIKYNKKTTFDLESPHGGNFESEKTSSVHVKKNNVRPKYEKVLPNKKEYKQISQSDYSPNKLPQKRDRELACPMCNWVFPESFTKEEINRHVNLCIDGKGVADRENYEKTEKMVKSKKIVDSSDSDDQEELKKIEEQLNKKCPHCKLVIGLRSKEFQQRHLKECYQETNDTYASNKLLYQELGNIPKKTVDSYWKYNTQKKY
ncbi:hypothetical protein SteCoe_31648 [Stentor coeruleus]|uniref:Uncharacterized protein n=1 Tax=Stentor coeruleus TaxID=5963 RepID=A0A1R2B0W5_9CILI|nr:hypothetical protein SteCoe_31648 [Stentor coeruleus]